MISVTLVCATIDDPALVARSIASVVVAARRSGITLQVIVVDQSEHFGTADLSFDGSEMDLRLIHSRVRGLSYNRNIGLSEATGQYIMFWDADCLMHPEFFDAFMRLAPSGASLFYGCIKSETTAQDVFRKWPRSQRRVSPFFRWQLSTSVNCVWRNEGCNRMLRLDERFGIGAQFGSCEDVDFFVRLRGRSVYSPQMIVFHPEQTVEMVPLAKARSYSFGFGALCRKHAFKFGAVYLALTMFKKMAQVLSGNVQFQTAMILIRDRLRGFMAFPNP